MQVVARGAGIRMRLIDLPTGFLYCQRALDRLSRLDARLDMEIADQMRIVGFERVVGGVMQLDTVGQMLTPAIRADSVKHRCKLAAGFGKLLHLCGRRLKLDAYCALHMTTVPYTMLLGKRDGQ